MAINHCFAGVAVTDRDSAFAWYERLLGRPADLIPNENEVAWQLAGTAWIYVVVDPDRAGTALLTLLVDDLERHVAELAERGLATGGIDTLPGVMRKAEITDPEGNLITFGEDLSADH